MIEIRDLQKEYGHSGSAVLACRVRELSVARGEQVALIGRSGVGKSTLLNIIAGLVLPSSGTVRVADIDVPSLSEGGRDRFRARHIGMVFQTFNLLQPFTAYENVVLGALFAHRADRETRLRAVDLLERVGLGDRTHHRPNQLSVGQMQRVAICRALINRPDLILADEPLGNQDPETGRQVLALLLQIARDEGRTVVMVTHDMNSAALMQRTVDLAALAA